MDHDLAKERPDGESPAGMPKETGVSKPLLAAVIIMGVMIVAGVVLLLWVMAHRFLHPAPGPAVETPALPASASAPETHLAVPMRPGEWIRCVTPRPDGKLAVTLSRQDGSGRILLWSPEQGRVTAELNFDDPTPAPRAEALPPE